MNDFDRRAAANDGLVVKVPRRIGAEVSRGCRRGSGRPDQSIRYRPVTRITPLSPCPPPG